MENRLIYKMIAETHEAVEFHIYNVIEAGECILSVNQKHSGSCAPVATHYPLEDNNMI